MRLIHLLSAMKSLIRVSRHAVGPTFGGRARLAAAKDVSPTERKIRTYVAEIKKENRQFWPNLMNQQSPQFLGHVLAR
jgi:hypothetical protein